MIYRKRMGPVVLRVAAEDKHGILVLELELLWMFILPLDHFRIIDVAAKVFEVALNISQKCAFRVSHRDERPKLPHFSLDLQFRGGSWDQQFRGGLSDDRGRRSGGHGLPDRALVSCTIGVTPVRRRRHARYSEHRAGACSAL